MPAILQLLSVASTKFSSVVDQRV